MKKIDQLILTELKKDPQTPFIKIAKKLGISPETVRKRYGKMKQNEQIIGCSVSIDLSKLGYQSMVWVWIKDERNQPRANIIDSLKKCKNIFAVTEITGDEFHILATAVAKDLKDLSALINGISSILGVCRLEFCLSDKLFFPIQ